MRERRTEDAEENQEDGRRRQTHENGGETHIVYLWRGIHSISMAITRDPKEPVLLIAIKIMRHAKLCLLVIMLSYLRVLALRKDVQGTVYLWAEGASLIC